MRPNSAQIVQIPILRIMPNLMSSAFACATISPKVSRTSLPNIDRSRVRRNDLLRNNFPGHTAIHCLLLNVAVRPGLIEFEFADQQPFRTVYNANFFHFLLDGERFLLGFSEPFPGA